MVNLDKIYTRGGDSGETSLGSGNRVPKHDLRVAAYGTSDEANAVIGVARLHTEGETDAMLARIQNDLFDLGADIANPNIDDKLALRIIKEQIEKLEKNIDDINNFLTDLSSFVLPGGSLTSSYLHLARTVCRRSERSLVKLIDSHEVNSFCLSYLNRLSDLLFVMARYENEKATKNNLAYGNYLLSMYEQKEKKYEEELNFLIKGHQ